MLVYQRVYHIISSNPNLQGPSFRAQFPQTFFWAPVYGTCGGAPAIHRWVLVPITPISIWFMDVYGIDIL